MISIRIVGPDEIDGAKEFIRSIFPDAMVQINEDDTVLLAEYDGNAVGFAHMVDDGERIILQGLGVESSMRGHGVGTLLLDHAMDIIESEGRPAYLKVKSLNPAIELYARYGFTLKKFGQTNVLVRKPHS